MDMAAIMLARLELERRIEAEHRVITARGPEAVLMRCWGCCGDLRTRQEVEAGFLCKRCQRRRQWERN